MNVLDLQWGPGGRLGLGAAAGLVMVAFMVVAIVLDLGGAFRPARPPPYIGADTEISVHEVCEDLSAGSVAVSMAAAKWARLGWPELPAPVLRPCGAVHEPAAPGVLRWRRCDTLRMVDGEATPPCPGGTRRGGTYAQVIGGRVIAADVYIRAGAPACTLTHELGHVLGLLVSPEVDAATPYVEGAHTERPGHVMGIPCGDGWSWLDRRPGGDWAP